MLPDISGFRCSFETPTSRGVGHCLWRGYCLLAPSYACILQLRLFAVLFLLIVATIRPVGFSLVQVAAVDAPIVNTRPLKILHLNLAKRVATRRIVHLQYIP